MARTLLITVPIWLLILSVGSGQSLVINEIMSSNLSTVYDEDGDFEDWIELKNIGDTAIDLTGFGLSDNNNRPFKWVFPSGIIQSGDFVFVWASGKDKKGVNPDWAEVFPFESEWQYYDREKAPIQNWTAREFDDSGWNTGNGLFGYGRDFLGYGTLLDYGGDLNNKHISYYFRKSFNLGSYPDNAILRFRLKVDDGAVVYLNGVEVDRFHMPKGEIGHQTRASEVVDIYEKVDFYVTTEMFQSGENTVAVSVHQNNRHSSDVAFDMRLDLSTTTYHTNFSISSEGEEILISNPQGVLLDRFAPIYIPTDISYGRKKNQAEELVWFDRPTPNRPNSDTSFVGITAVPFFSKPSGFYTSDFELEINSHDPNIGIYYTLDGSIPDKNRLAGKIYPYKNRFQQHPDSDPGEFLYDSIITKKYEQPLFIKDRTEDNNRTSQKSSS